MGTPEFSNIGKHCSVDGCRQIDYLLFTCDCCRQAFCLQHRSYITHLCPKANLRNATIAVCPLCAKGVSLIPEEDPNITWESHVNMDCDPSDYNSTEKRKCAMPQCGEILTFSSTIKCRDCNNDHCLEHRFGPAHNCAGAKKAEPSFQFMRLLSRRGKEDPKQDAVPSASASSSNLATTFFKLASSFRTTAEAGVTRLSNEVNQALSKNGESQSSNSDASGRASEQVEVCPHGKLRFSTAEALLEHVEKVLQQDEAMKLTLDACLKCSRERCSPSPSTDHIMKGHSVVSKA